jgi:hypothetical protein
MPGIVGNSWKPADHARRQPPRPPRYDKGMTEFGADDLPTTAAEIATLAPIAASCAPPLTREGAAQVRSPSPRTPNPWFAPELAACRHTLESFADARLVKAEPGAVAVVGAVLANTATFVAVECRSASRSPQSCCWPPRRSASASGPPQMAGQRTTPAAALSASMYRPCRCGSMNGRSITDTS